ncbi:GSCOCG00000264001-RA-CDS [Cotesia congregata]|uniref:Similar to MYCBP: c-Myc-binding protein (Bos taurus) n=1 Tax=Cotesia congregata TaxID=51543 RepID=A0A8J2HLZ3_COTCN|nr:GSCOCG00000264001-RA-CDS [Cotesia congregata]CAG5101193.1 Similar to MYCBP: c-Myc-binding protein (Bos taurus) [Cotesia congregata]
MASYKPTDSKRDEFRRYLERSGVLDGLTKVLIALYEEPEKPANAIEYIRKNLGGLTEITEEVGATSNVQDSESLEKKLQEAEAENRELRDKLAKLDLAEE